MEDEFRWAMEPTLGRYFLIYLAIVGCFALVRFVRIRWYLHSIRNEVPSLQALRKTGDAQRLSATAANLRCGLDMRLADLLWLKSLAIFTTLLSLWLVTSEAHHEFSWQFENRSVTGFTALLNTAFALCRRLAAGVAVSAVMYGLASFYEVSLLRRKTLSQAALEPDSEFPDTELGLA